MVLCVVQNADEARIAAVMRKTAGLKKHLRRLPLSNNEMLKKIPLNTLVIIKISGERGHVIEDKGQRVRVSAGFHIVEIDRSELILVTNVKCPTCHGTGYVVEEIEAGGQGVEPCHPTLIRS